MCGLQRPGLKNCDWKNHGVIPTEIVGRSVVMDLILTETVGRSVMMDLRAKGPARAEHVYRKLVPTVGDLDLTA